MIKMCLKQNHSFLKNKICHKNLPLRHDYDCSTFTEKYQKLENEKKTTRAVRKTHVGSMIRYQSLSMPVIVLSETFVDEDEKINVECDDEQRGNSNNPDSDNSPKEER